MKYSTENPFLSLFFKLPCKRLLFFLKNTQRAFLLLLGCKQVPSTKKFQQLNEHDFFSYSEINERTVWNGRFSKAWCCYTSIDWKCSSECMNLTGISRSTSNTTAQSDGLLQKVRSANKTQWFDRICQSKLRRTAFMQWNHHKIFETFYESGVQVHENLHFKDNDI